MSTQINYQLFSNTEVAFLHKPDKVLNRSFWIFKLVNYSWLVKLGTKIILLAIYIRLPIFQLIKSTIYKQFCGGKDIATSSIIIKKLASANVKTILDYAIEAKTRESDFENTMENIIKAIVESKDNPDVAYISVKITGIGKFRILKTIHEQTPLTNKEQDEFSRIKARLFRICENASQCKKGVLIDAEESWIQQPIDDLIEEMMENFNKTNPVVFNTIQLYRWDRMDFLKESFDRAQSKKYILGVKIVRGAYMEKERKRANRLAYTSPIQPDKASTDRDFNAALTFCIENIGKIACCVATHNEESCLMMVHLMDKNKIAHNHPMLFCAQLYGMGDHISFNLAQHKFNVAKYLPFGPVKEMMPYLIRRAEENTSISGQMSRELMLIKLEKERRKKLRQKLA